VRARLHGSAPRHRGAAGVVPRVRSVLRGRSVMLQETQLGVTTMTMAKALNEGLRAALGGDDRVLLLGEDIGTLGGVFRVTEGLKAEFGANRVLDTPLAESGIV